MRTSSLSTSLRIARLSRHSRSSSPSLRQDMRAGVAAHGMAALVQFADLPSRQKSRAINPVRGDEEVSTPLVLLEFAGDAQGAVSAVVEGEKHRHPSPG